MPRHIERVFPRDDADFVARVDAAALGAASPEELQKRLRATHSRAVVRARDLSGDSTQVWYVYRDGSWTGIGGE
jgi:hypothetical protein